jgi:hypothetical protein
MTPASTRRGLCALTDSPNRTQMRQLMIVLRSVQSYAGRLEQAFQRGEIDAETRRDLMAGTARRADSLRQEIQRLDLRLTVAYKPAERAAQTGTGDGTGKMQKRAKRAAWKQARGLPLTEKERKAVLKRVRFQIAREFGARDNNATQVRHLNDGALVRNANGGVIVFDEPAGWQDEDFAVDELMDEDFDTQE